MRWRVAVDLEGGPVGHEQLSALAHQLAGRGVCVSSLPGGRRVWVTLQEEGPRKIAVDRALRDVLDGLLAAGTPPGWHVAGTEVLALPEHVAG